MTSTTATADASTPRLLVVRNDKLGDFMLAWPALATLKAARPAPHITALVPSYTAPVARLCPWIDEVILDPGDEAPKAQQRQLLASLRQGHFTALLTLFSTTRIGWLGLRAGIPLRMAPATKWAQLFYNRRITQRRSRSDRPEYVYNQQLAEAMVEALALSPGEAVRPPFWPHPEDDKEQRRLALASQLGLASTGSWIYLHPGSGGSAVNLSPDAYAQLAQDVDRRMRQQGATQPHWIVTAGPGEDAVANTLVARLESAGLSARRLPPAAGLADFACSIAAADAFVAGSTGTLHIAGCLDVITVGFYPSHRSATPLRWQTCNAPEHRLAFHPPPGDQARDMSAVDLDEAAAAIAATLVDADRRATS